MPTWDSKSECPECGILRAKLAEQRALFDKSWDELQARYDSLKRALAEFQRQIDKKSGNERG